jgi:hypothetical protein
VVDEQTQALLQEVLRRESRSLLMYVGDAYPWTTSGGEPALAALRQLVRAEAGAVAALGRFMARHGITPAPVGAYPVHFTNYNFIALQYLLPHLIDAERAGITALEADLAAVKDPGAKAAVEQLLAAKRTHLAGLERLASPPAFSANAAPAT